MSPRLSCLDLILPLTLLLLSHDRSCVVIIFIPFLPTQRMLDSGQLRPYKRLRPDIPSMTITLRIPNFRVIAVILT